MPKSAQIQRQMVAHEKILICSQMDFRSQHLTQSAESLSPQHTVSVLGKPRVAPLTTRHPKVVSNCWAAPTDVPQGIGLQISALVSASQQDIGT